MGRSEAGFFHALAALLFMAFSAWVAAALCARLPAAPELPEETAAAAVSSLPFRALLLRREALLPAGAFSDLSEGTRLSARETGTESALFFRGADGWETLSPADARDLTPKKLDALLTFTPAEADEAAARLVYGFDLTLAALLKEGEPPEPGPCRLTIAGIRDPVPARLLRVSRDETGRTALLFRVTEIPEELYRLRFIEGTIE